MGKSTISMMIFHYKSTISMFQSPPISIGNPPISMGEIHQFLWEMFLLSMGISMGYPHAIPPREVPLHATDSTPPRLLGSNLESSENPPYRQMIFLGNYHKCGKSMKIHYLQRKIHENPLFVDNFQVHHGFSLIFCAGNDGFSTVFSLRLSPASATSIWFGFLDVIRPIPGSFTFWSQGIQSF